MAKVIVNGVKGSLTQKIITGETGEHIIISDEPKEAGGQNKGPNPYELLLSALGSCTAMTVLLYSQRKNWPLESIEVTVDENRMYAEDCVDCESQTGFVHQIHRQISLTGPLSDEQKQRLLEIASHCPVHKTLVNEIKISDELIS